MEKTNWLLELKKSKTPPCDMSVYTVGLQNKELSI